MNEREQGESSVEQFLKAIEARLDVDDDDAHVLTRDGFELLKAAWNTRAAPPATTAGGGDVDSLNWVLSNDGWDTLPHAMTRKAIGVEELNAARIAIRHLRLGLAYHTRALESARPVPPVDEIVRETMRVFRDEWQCRIIDTDNLDEVCASIGIALRTALSVRTAGEKALSYEEIDDAFWKGSGGRRGSCPQLLAVEIIAGLHAVHALVAQRGVR